MAMKITVIWQIVIDVSEEYAAFVFRVETLLPSRLRQHVVQK
jgi:hypothetical protein